MKTMRIDGKIMRCASDAREMLTRWPPEATQCGAEELAAREAAAVKRKIGFHPANPARKISARKAGCAQHAAR